MIFELGYIEFQEPVRCATLGSMSQVHLLSGSIDSRISLKFICFNDPFYASRKSSG